MEKTHIPAADSYNTLCLTQKNGAGVHVSTNHRLTLLI